MKKIKSFKEVRLIGMTGKKYHAKLLENSSKLLTNKEFSNSYIADDKYFTHNRKLSFRTVTLFIFTTSEIFSQNKIQNILSNGF